eukprot:7388147-Prymnesium_polylepis.1
MELKPNSTMSAARLRTLGPVRVSPDSTTVLMGSPSLPSTTTTSEFSRAEVATGPAPSAWKRMLFERFTKLSPSARSRLSSSMPRGVS